jgi:aromatic amino acid lyase
VDGHAGQPSVALELENAALYSKLGLDLGFAARFYRAMALTLSSRHGSDSAATGEQHEPPHALEINTFVAEDRMRRLLRRVDPCDEVVLTGSDLTIEQVARVAWDSAPVAVAPAARSRLRRARDVVDRLVSGEQPVYGLNTNVGELKDHQRIADADQATQRDGPWRRGGAERGVRCAAGDALRRGASDRAESRLDRHVGSRPAGAPGAAAGGRGRGRDSRRAATRRGGPCRGRDRGAGVGRQGRVGVRILLEGSSLWWSEPSFGVQDPISFRSASQVHGAVLDVVEMVPGTVETELNSTGDNPMVLVDPDEIISDGNFHPAALSIALDTLGIALLQKTATALNAEVRLGANPASLDYVPVAGAIEDHATMAVEGAAKADRAVSAAFELFAIELLVAAQAIDLRDGITLGTGTAAAYARTRQLAPPMTEDRLMSDDIAAVATALWDGSLLRAVGDAVQRPFGLGIVARG